MAAFESAFEKMIYNEGGYKLINVPGDTGGQTYAGIARNFHPNWKGWSYIDSNDLTNSKLKESVMSFYKTKFWNTVKGDNIVSQKIAETIFDFAVNTGAVIAAKLAQGIIGADIDGKIGPQTLTKLNSYDEEKFILKFALAKVSRYAQICNQNKTQSKFLLGWINRTLKDIE